MTNHSNGHSSPEHTTVCIIGGGPAGSTLASYLAIEGIDCVVLEREAFPRHHVGESLVPATTPVLAEIGALDKVDAFGFPKKFGAAWTSDVGPTAMNSHDFSAAEVLFSERTQAGVHQPYTYHVDRSKFDEILLDHASELGADVREQHRVEAVEIHDGGVDVRYLDRETGKVGRLAAKMIVDASGRNTVLGNQLGLKTRDPVFDQYAIHGWFEGLDRTALAPDKEQADYIFIHFLPISNTWVWQIPITETITSIGVVTQKANFGRRTDNERFFWECVSSRPALETALRAATPASPMRSEGDYSYAMSKFADDRMLLIGDAARFVDPIFSSGVSVAMNSARLASADIVEACKADEFGADAFARFQATLNRGVSNWHRFIGLYYRLNVLFTAFVQDPRYRIDILKLLQGDVYDEETPAVLDEMQRVVEVVEANPDHLWHRHLGTMLAPDKILA